MPPTMVLKPAVIQAAGNKPKIIKEFFGRVNSGETGVSIAHMVSPEGWVEPGQTPAFTEYTLVIRGMLRLNHRSGTMDVGAGEAVVTHPGEWVQYGSPAPGGAEYIAVCIPAFSPETVRRDA
jgi:mannose-6-phosphate isomerase-like protein (cupin superfamily)